MRSEESQALLSPAGKAFHPHKLTLISQYWQRNTESRTEMTTPILPIKRTRAGWVWLLKVFWLVSGRAGLCHIPVSGLPGQKHSCILGEKEGQEQGRALPSSVPLPYPSAH